MANQKISALPALDSIPEGAYVPVVVDGKVYKAPAGGVGIARGVRYDRVDANGFPVEATLLTTDGQVLPRQFYCVNTSYPFYATGKINLPDDIVTVGTYAFRYCKGLAEISLPNVRSIGTYAFQGCSNIKAFNFPHLSKVETYTFQACTALERVIFPEATVIDGSAFQTCTSLQTVELPSAVTVNSSVFNGCTALEEITLPKVETVNNGAFANCTALKTVTLGSSGNPVTSIMGNVFANCTQSDLTITIYTTGGAALDNAPWGATNATIIYKEA